MFIITGTAWTAEEQNHILNLFHQWNIWFKESQHCLTFLSFFFFFQSSEALFWVPCHFASHLLSNGLDLSLGVRHSHQVSEGQVLHTVAGWTHLLVHLVAATNTAVEDTQVGQKKSCRLSEIPLNDNECVRVPMKCGGNVFLVILTTLKLKTTEIQQLIADRLGWKCKNWIKFTFNLNSFQLKNI